MTRTATVPTMPIASILLISLPTCLPFRTGRSRSTYCCMGGSDPLPELGCLDVPGVGVESERGGRDRTVAGASNELPVHPRNGSRTNHQTSRFLQPLQVRAQQ